MIHYGVTKTAQIALARGLAETTAGTNVTVNSVLPGPTRSEGVEQFVQDLAKGQGTDAATVRSRVLSHRTPLFAAEAVCDPGGSGGDGRVCVQPTGLGHERGGAAGRWRRGPVHRVRGNDEAKIVNYSTVLQPGRHRPPGGHPERRPCRRRRPAPVGDQDAQRIAGRDPYALYDDLCRLTGQRHDPCLLDTFIAAVRFMAGEPEQPWWKYTAERKRELAARSASRQ